jgi:hypothetical protein
MGSEFETDQRRGSIMNTLRNGCIFTGLSLLMTVTPAVAHHSAVAEYDSKNVVTITGKVSRVAWANPHVRVYVLAKDSKGVEQTWDFELQSVNSLTRRGWSRNSLKPGDVVTIEAARARDGATRGNARGAVALADGRKLFSGDSVNRDE